MKRRTFVALATATTALAGTARAQGSYPDKPITMVVPAPPGGGTDLVARLYSDLLGQELGQQVLVDNKGGGNGNVGTAFVARAKPDGYTLLMQYSAYHSANPALIKDLNWKPDDFVGVAMGAVAPHVIVIAKKVPAEDLKSFIAYAKANKGKLNYASVGAGSVPHLGGVLLNKAAGIDLTHIPYKGAGPATQDLVAGQVELMIVTPPSVSGHIRNGNVKALALASENRLPAAAHRRQAQRRDAQDRQDGRRRRPRQPARHRPEGLVPGADGQLRQGRGRDLGQGHPRQQHHLHRVGMADGVRRNRGRPGRRRHGPLLRKDRRGL